MTTTASSDLAEGTGNPDGDALPNYRDLDSDNDGQSDAAETIAGTLPVNAADCFVILSAQDIPGGGCMECGGTISWAPPETRR